MLPEAGELGPLLERAGAEVVLHPLAVLRRSRLSPAGGAELAGAIVRDRRVLGELACERQAALVHANTSVVLAGRAVARRAGAAYLAHVREIYAGHGGQTASLLWPVMRRRLLAADALACISDAVARQFAGEPNVEVLRDGLPDPPVLPARDAARDALGLPPERFSVALVGRVSDWKGQAVLVRALAESPLAGNGALALLAGDVFPGNEQHEQRLAALIGRLGLTDRVHRLGFRRDVGTVLAAADALAVPSIRPEPLGLVALEGAAAGLPVVGSAHGGLTEVVRHGRTGLLIAPDDPATLARALRALADDPAAARRMGAAGRADVRRRFRVERMLAELQDLYDRVVAQRAAEVSRARVSGARQR